MGEAQLDVRTEFETCRTVLPFGLYIHIPFCVRKCAYCDFVSYGGCGAQDIEGYIDLVMAELSAAMDDPAVAEALEHRAACGRKPFDTVYIGGGTPTLVPAPLVARLVGAALEHAEPGAEVTVEANPGTVTTSAVRVLREAGVNRISLGAQSFHDEELRVLGRIHTAREIVEAVNAVRKAGVDNLNIDLMYAFPGQTLESWAETLRAAVSLCPEHISCYSLILEEGTAIERALASGKLAAVSEEADAEMYACAIEFLTGAGFEHYEVSNFATPGYEARHNIGYWVNGSYLGIGASAHSHLVERGLDTSVRRANATGLSEYADKVRALGLGTAVSERIDRRTEMGDFMMLGLRMLRGVSVPAFRARFGVDPREVYRAELERLVGFGLVRADHERIALTEKGLFLGNAVFGEFV